MNFTSKEEMQYARACLAFAKKLGLIDDDSPDALQKRCEEENSKREMMLKSGETVYGVTHFSLPAYLQYELTGFKLNFVSENEEIKRVYEYKPISYEEKVEFYEKNSDLFTRYAGDSFHFKEVEAVIEKRIREAEFENEIQNILCQLTDR